MLRSLWSGWCEWFPGTRVCTHAHNMVFHPCIKLEVEPLERTMILQKSNVVPLFGFLKLLLNSKWHGDAQLLGCPFLWRNIQLTWGSGCDMKWKSTIFCTRFAAEPWMFDNVCKLHVLREFQSLILVWCLWTCDSQVLRLNQTLV